MNVMYIVGGEGNRYGSEIIAIDLIEAGKDHGINYTVVTANKGAVSEACDRLGVTNYTTPFTFFVYRAMGNTFLDAVKKGIWRARAEYLTRKAAEFIEKMVDMKSIDLIHSNLTRDLLGGILAEKYNIPHVWHIQELFKAHYQLSFLRKNQLEWMANRGDRFIAISQTVANEWIENGLPRDKVSVIYNGIDSSRVLPREDYPRDGILKLVMVGHLVPAKGQELVIERLARLPDAVRCGVEFDCYGEGNEDYKKRLREKAAVFGVALNLRGYCSDVGSVLKGYDIGVNYSRGEGFGLSTVEYMAAGICPVVANTGANMELICDGENGFVFDYSDEDSFGTLIQRLHEDRESVRRASIKARENALANYSIETMRQQVYALYGQLRRNGRSILR